MRHDKEMKGRELMERRRRLRNLLKEEKDQLEAELRGLSGDNYARLQDMKEKSDDLKTSRETHRKQVLTFILVNPLKTKPAYMWAGVYGKCVL